ncbi:MAG: RNA methyltransferase [bacterium]
MRPAGIAATPPVAADDALPNVRIVLVRPRGAGNIGAAARAMRNCGVGDLVLVRPAVRRLAAAERMAVHARELVRGAPVLDDLASAVADCGLVIGTTCRGGGYRTALEDLETLAPQAVAQSASARVAFLFGPEDHGLSNADLRHCQRLVAIDTHADYASLNLSQAVLLVCHALRRATRSAVVRLPGPAPASAAALDGLYAHLETALGRIGFLNRQNPGHIMFALRGLLGRSAPSEHEVRTLRGIARQIEWIAGVSQVTDDPSPAGPEAVEAPGAAPLARRRSRR